MGIIEDQSEKLNLLEKTEEIDARRKKKNAAMDELLKKEKEKAEIEKLKQGSMLTSSSQLDQEDSHRRSLIHELQQNSNDSQKPIVKVLTNIQGIT